MCSACSTFALALVAQLIKQPLSVLEVDGLEALGEPVVDFTEHRARLVMAPNVAREARKAGRCAQFDDARDFNRLAKNLAQRVQQELCARRSFGGSISPTPPDVIDLIWVLAI